MRPHGDLEIVFLFLKCTEWTVCFKAYSHSVKSHMLEFQGWRTRVQNLHDLEPLAWIDREGQPSRTTRLARHQQITQAIQGPNTCWHFVAHATTETSSCVIF